MFTKERLDRYARHIVLPGVGAAGQRRLNEARVLVVGAGGLGSPVLLYLAAAGVGTLEPGAIGVVDDDRVDLTNLQRQVLHGTPDVGRPKTEAARDRLRALDPDVRLELHAARLSRENARELVRAFDLVIDGSDSFPTRYLVNDACVLEGVPFVYGAISQFEGQVSVFHAPAGGGRGPCYRCVFPTPPPAGSVPNCAEGGVFGALPGVIGSLMAAEAIKHTVALGETLAGRLLHYDALFAETRTVRLERDPACPACGDAPSITELGDYDAFCGA